MPLAGVNAKETLKRKNNPAVPCRLPAECPHYVQKALHRPYIKHCLDSSNEVHKNMTLNIYSVTSWRQVTLVSKCQKRYRSTSESLPTEVCRGPQKSSGRRAEGISPSGQMSPLRQEKLPHTSQSQKQEALPNAVCKRNSTGGAACPKQRKASQSTCSALNAHKTLP